DTDGGPQFQAEAFLQFLTTWAIKHRTPSPCYPQSNGRAELGIKTAKRLLKENTGPNGQIDNDRIARAVLQYHNTPLRDGPMSPAQLLFGRALADFLPANPKAYELHPYWAKRVKDYRRQRHLNHRKMASRYNVGTRRLGELTIGQTVSVQHHVSKRWDRTAVVIGILPHRRYNLQMSDTGNITIRNRRFLKPIKLNRQVGFPSGPTPQPITHHSHTSADEAGPDEEEDHANPDEEENRTPEAPPVPSYTVTDETTESNTRERPHGTRNQLPRALRNLLPHNNPGLKE
ncbi:MAG: hypothetical protein AAFO91_14455, partial [Bacteroidota bacterium]